MSREMIGFILVMLVFVVAALVVLSVKRLRQRQETELPAFLEAEDADGLNTLYVSTVYADRPLDRIWAYGVGIRGKARVSASETGVSINRVGERSILIPLESVIEVGRAQATIDKGVEKDGLTTIIWQHGNTKLQSVFRFTNLQARRGFESQLNQLIGAKLG